MEGRTFKLGSGLRRISKLRLCWECHLFPSTLRLVQRETRTFGRPSPGARSASSVASTEVAGAAASGPAYKADWPQA